MKMISKATLLALLAAAVTFFAPAAAHADSYIDYQITGAFQTGGTLSGYFVVDTTSGLVTNGQMIADTQVFSCPDVSPYGCALSAYEGFYSSPGAPTSYSILSLNWLPGPFSSNFNFTLNNSYCAYCGQPGLDSLTSGSATMFGTDANPKFSINPGNNDAPVSTPEPTSAVLLSIGLLGLGFAGLKQRNAINNA